MCLPYACVISATDTLIHAVSVGIFAPEPADGYGAQPDPADGSLTTP
jgi:hypothetical protein